MKRIISFILVAILILSVIGCGNKSADLKIENGTLSWEADGDAASYEVNIQDDTKSVTENSFDLTTAFQEDGEYEVNVGAVYADGTNKEIGSISVTVTVLEKARISIEGVGNEKSFVIQAVEGATSYSYQIDGEAPVEFEIEAGSTYLLPITNSSQTLTVYAQGVSEGTDITCTSESNYSYLR